MKRTAKGTTAQIAAHLKAHYDHLLKNANYAEANTVEAIARGFAAEFEKQNPTFATVRFLIACGLEG